MTEETNKKKISGFRILNAFLVFAFLFGGGIFFMVATLGITEMLFIPSVITNVLLVYFYGKYKQNGTMKVPMMISRCLAILMFIIIFGSPMIGIWFKDNQSMYFLKREVFILGVRPKAGDVLPKKLPKDISGYYFRTGMQFPAQDYHPYADLIFRCDAEYMDELEEYVTKNGLILRERSMPFEDYFDSLNLDEKIKIDNDQMSCLASKYADVPSNLLYRLEYDDILRFAENATVYRGINSGCAFDEKTGYVIIWG